MEDSTDNSAPKIESETSEPNTEDDLHLYEIELGWRIVYRMKPFKKVRMLNLGDWHDEKMLVVAESVYWAEQIATEHHMDISFMTLGVTPLNC